MQLLKSSASSLHSKVDPLLSEENSKVAEFESTVLPSAGLPVMLVFGSDGGGGVSGGESPRKILCKSISCLVLHAGSDRGCVSSICLKI